MFRRPLLLLAVLLPALAACGFQVRGAGGSDVQAERVYLRDSNADGVAAEVRGLLRLAKVRLTGTAQEAEYVILLADEYVNRDVLSVSPRTGKVEEYQLTLVVQVSVFEPGGKRLLDRERVSMVRDFTFDEQEVLGKFTEEETLRDELARDAAEQVLRMFNAAVTHRT